MTVQWRDLARNGLGFALVAGSALTILPNVAAAQNVGMCRSFTSPVSNLSYQASVALLLDQATAAARETLGSQFGAVWLDNVRQRWSVALAPGTLDQPAATSAIAAEISRRLPASEAAYMNGLLAVEPTPYSEAELLDVQALATHFLQSINVPYTTAVACVPAASTSATDAWRVDAVVFTGNSEPTSDLAASVHDGLAPFGEKIRLSFARGNGAQPGADIPSPSSETRPPSSTPALPSLRLGDYVSLPKTSRCVRGATIGSKVARRTNLTTVDVVARGRRTRLRSGKRAEVRLAAKRSTRVAVTAASRDGRSVTKVFVFRRCG